MKEVADKLMSYEEYNKGQYSWPYFFSIEKDGQTLYYFGANHSVDPENKQYPELQKRWQEFLEKTGKENCLAFNEGGRRPIAQSKETAIKEGAEAHLITYLAAQENILVESPEPDLQEELSAILKEGFKKEETQYYYFARSIYSWSNKGRPEEFKKYITRSFERDKKESGWPSFDFSLQHMKAIHKELFGGEFDETNEEFFYSVARPDKTTTSINQIARISSTYRNVFVVQEIQKYWGQGKNLFVVFGGSHAVIQEPSLKELL